jgi:dCTP deaminase
MILTWSEIKSEHENRKIIISDFKDSHITTNSYDLELANNFIRYTDEVLDMKKDNNHEILTFQDHEPILLKKWDFLLWSTKEIVWSNHYVPIIHNKSGIARLWLFVHITADLIDIWSIWNITLQLYATLSVTIYPGMKIAQVSFWQPKWEITLYEGKYKNSEWPVASKSFIK